MIYITGDAHGDIRKLKDFNNLKSPLCDYLIVAGDFGFIWDNSQEEQQLLDKLGKLNYNILFVDGNHENHELLDNMPVSIWNGGKVHIIKPNIIHLMRGQVFTIEGKKIFTFGGAESIDKQNRIKDISWWERELPSYVEYQEGLDNLEKHNWDVDYIITHTASKQMFVQLHKYVWGVKHPTAIENYFDTLEEQVNFKHWYFGHFHGDEQFDKQHTLIYQNFKEIL